MESASQDFGIVNFSWTFTVSPNNCIIPIPSSFEAVPIPLPQECLFSASPPCFLVVVR